MQTYGSIFVISGSLFALFFSIGLFLKPRPDRRNYLEGTLFLLLSVFIFCAYYRIFTGREAGNLLGIAAISFLFMTPLIYLYFRMLVNPLYRIRSHHRYLFIVPVILSFLLILSLDISLIRTFISPELMKIFNFSGIFGSNIYMFTVLFYLNYTYTSKLKSSHISQGRHLTCLFVFTFLLNGIIGFYFIDLIFRLHMIKYSYFFGTFLIYYFFIIYLVFPEMTAYPTKRSVSGTDNSLREIDVDKAVSSLERLLINEKIFADEKLSLRSLSDKINLTPHQLSALLNNVLGTNFYSYINSFRIEEAKKLLLEKPEMKIIEIAYSVGFNSQSVFYKAFREMTGITPREFKKNQTTLFKPTHI